jgi:indole-3-glycerol phosphate synthase
LSPAATPDILVQIVEKRRERLREASLKQAFTDPPRKPILQTAGNNRFLAAVQQKRGNAIIAEIKMGSPRLGSLEGRFEPIETARKYAEGGASALSVVVEPDFFFGSYDLLAVCTEASGLPSIAKDFIVDPLQLRWARRAGASAILLIAALYDPIELQQWAQLARQFGLVPLIELHDLFDLTKLDGAVWELVGVNNRDLRTMKVELGNSLALVHSLPSSALKISESGLADAGDLRTLRSVGFDGFLIGESLLTSADPLTKLRELVG